LKGPGKSHLINAWCHLITSVLRSSGFYRVVNPTGRAAHNVYGITHQSLLSIVPSDEDAFIPDLKTGLALNDLQARLGILDIFERLGIYIHR
jgi:hypothetical protein